MDQEQKNILIGGCALLLPFLRKKDNNTDNGIKNDLSRFDNYPTGEGIIGGGYYDRLTQERIQEQAKKDSPLYFGDKSQNSIYDSFYDYNGVPVQANGVTAHDLTATDYETATKCVRVRIVPNSLYVTNEFTRDTVGELRENHIYACVVEIFNPFPFVGLDNTKFKIDIDNIFLSSESMYIVDGDSKKHTLRYHYDTAAIRNTISKGIDQGIYNYLKQQENNEGVYANLPSSFPGQTSIYLPVFLSMIPFESGQVKRMWPLDDGVEFYKYNTLHTETVGETPYPITGVEFTITIKANGVLRNHCVIASNSANSYSFDNDKSVSVSHQEKEYFSVDSYPIYRRNDFWLSIFKQRKLDLSDNTGGSAARSYWWNYSRLRTVQEFAPFGSVELKLE